MVTGNWQLILPLTLSTVTLGRRLTGTDSLAQIKLIWFASLNWMAQETPATPLHFQLVAAFV